MSQHKNSQHNNSQHYDSQHNDSRHFKSQHKDNMMNFNNKPIMLTVLMLAAFVPNVVAPLICNKCTRRI